MPASSRVRYRILQLLEVALYLSTCADTAVSNAGPAAAVTAANTATPAHADASGRRQASQQQQKGCLRSTRAALCSGLRPEHSSKRHSSTCAACEVWRRRLTKAQAAARRARICAAVQSRSSSQQHAGNQQQAPCSSRGVRDSSATAPAQQGLGRACCAAQGAETLSAPALANDEVSTLAAAVGALSTASESVQAELALRLQGITADCGAPEAVADVLVDVDAVQASVLCCCCCVRWWA